MRIGFSAALVADGRLCGRGDACRTRRLRRRGGDAQRHCRRRPGAALRRPGQHRAARGRRWRRRPDGSHKTQITGTDADHGAGEGDDDYHAYWSPDGKHVVYAHLNWNFITDDGQGKWDIRVADFVDDGVDPPHLANVRVVRPGQRPLVRDAVVGARRQRLPLHRDVRARAMDTELFFCRLTAKGCDVQQLTDVPAWNEQAIFTPDMKNVIFMSSRDQPGFFNTFARAGARRAGLTDRRRLPADPADLRGRLPPAGVQETTDLYQLDLATGAVRRLTTRRRRRLDHPRVHVGPEELAPPVDREPLPRRTAGAGAGRRAAPARAGERVPHPPAGGRPGLERAQQRGDPDRAAHAGAALQAAEAREAAPAKHIRRRRSR